MEVIKMICNWTGMDTNDDACRIDVDKRMESDVESNCIRHRINRIGNGVIN